MFDIGDELQYEGYKKSPERITVKGILIREEGIYYEFIRDGDNDYINQNSITHKWEKRSV